MWRPNTMKPLEEEGFCVRTELKPVGRYNKACPDFKEEEDI